MSFQQNVVAVDRGVPGDFTGGRFYPGLGLIVDETINSSVVVGNFAYYVFNSNNVTSAKQTGAHLAGLVVNTHEAITYNFGQIYLDTPVSDIAPGQTAPVAQKGSYFVQLQALIGSGPYTQFMSVYSRDTDGAPVIGVTTESGYTKTNWVVTDPSSLLVLNGIIRISNVEFVEG